MSEEKREHVRAYDGEWHKIHRQDCNMEDCCSLDSCGISDEERDSADWPGRLLLIGGSLRLGCCWGHPRNGFLVSCHCSGEPT